MPTDILNITNGDSAVVVMKAGEIPGTFLSWKDVLHEGPVSADLSLQALSKLRARYIASRGWGNFEDIAKDFGQRNHMLSNFRNYAKVRLWFEHDLYDQLQILQILDAFSEEALGDTGLTLICTDQYLGALKAHQIKNLFQFEEVVSPAQFNLAKKAWAAFRSATPEKWHALLDEDTRALSFLEGAILRMLEEYPSQKNGLGRTAEKALKIIASGENRPIEIFSRYCETEERVFLGDWSFWSILNEMIDGEAPLLRVEDGGRLSFPPGEHQRLEMTPCGITILNAEQHIFDFRPPNRWIGGVHLKPGHLWMWDTETKTLHQKNAP